MKDCANRGAGVSRGRDLIVAALVGGVGFTLGMFLVTGREQKAAAQQADQGRRADAQADDEESTADDGAVIRAAVESVLRVQEEAWNRGDIEAFVKHYWNSDDVTFSSGGKTTRGWTATRDRYRERYPTPEKMGRVTFSNLEMTPLGDAAALVLGEWRLERDSDPLAGNFSLVFRKLDDRWVIIHDHTSRLMD